MRIYIYIYTPSIHVYHIMTYHDISCMYIANWHIHHTFIIHVSLPSGFIPAEYVIIPSQQHSNSERPAIGSTSSTESARATSTGKPWNVTLEDDWMFKCSFWIRFNVMLNSGDWFWIPHIDLTRCNWPYLVFPSPSGCAWCKGNSHFVQRPVDRLVQCLKPAVIPWNTGWRWQIIGITPQESGYRIRFDMVSRLAPEFDPRGFKPIDPLLTLHITFNLMGQK